jgi:PAS domain S-box-containing protein
MTNGRAEALKGYGVAVCSVLAGLAARLALAGMLDSSVPFVTFFPAVMFAVWFGGLGPAVLAALLSVVAASYFVIPPYNLIPSNSADIIRAGTFAGFSIFICALYEALRKSRGERKESKRAAERDRDMLQTTLSSIGDAVLATDENGRVTYLNRVAQELTGWSQEDAAGKPISDVFSVRKEGTGLAVENPVDRVIREGVRVVLASDTVLISRDGRQIPIEDSAAPICDDHRRVFGVALVFRDVTARRKAENALKTSEERLKLALDAGGIGVWDWDVVQNRDEWSDRIYDILGVERGKHAGRVEDFTELIHPDDRERIKAAIRAAMERDAAYDVEYRVVHPNGSLHWVSSMAQVFRNKKNEPIRMLGATRDITARKHSEAQRLQQWHTFDTALSYTPDFTYIFDLEGRFTYVNRALLSLWQKPLEEAVGRNFFDLGYPAELAERLQRQIQEVIETQKPVRDQTLFTGPTGESRHYEYIFVPVLAPDGRVEAVAGSTRDITDRIIAEEALRASEERLTLALEAGGGIGAWDWDVPGDRVYCNPEFARMFSVDPESAAAGAPLAEFVAHIHADDRGRVGEKIERAMETGGDLREEYRVVQPDGSARWVQVRGRCHLDEAGKPMRFPGVAFDVSDRKHAEEALRQSQDRLRAVYDGSYEYMGLLDIDGTLLDCNPASLTFANNTRADVIGRPFWETPWFSATPGMPEMVRGAIARARAGEFLRMEMLWIRPSGEGRTFDFSLYPVRNEQGQVALMVPEGRDITDRKRAEEEVRRANEELKRVNRELEEFAYVASHDLQEPLRMVNIYTQLILSDIHRDPTKIGEYAGFVQRGVERMEGLIHDLLTFSRAVQDEERPIGDADLSDSLNEALSVLKNRIEESGCTITADRLPTVRGDTSQMSHVFQNLLSNAMKYRKPDVLPRVHISVARDGDYWVVAVRDNGLGFEPQYAERIFGLFKRLYKEEYPGTGLGLAICKRIVERYGGRIWAEGRPGEGAVFYFSLPSVD